MTKREIASLVIKLMGVFILLKSIAYLPMVFGSFSIMRSEGLLFSVFIVMISIVTAAIPLAFSILVITLSDKAAAWLIRNDNTVENTDNTISKDDVMIIAVSCIGLYFIVAAMPMLINALLINPARMYRRAGIPYVGPSGMFHILRNLVVPAVQIALGIWLFASSKGIVKLWKKIRS